MLERQLAAKAELRRELRRLPIEDKLIIVALMQRRANDIRRAVGRPVKPEWPIDPTTAQSDYVKRLLGLDRVG